MKAIFAISLSLAAFVLTTKTASANEIIFDDFNANEGHFNVAPNFSGTTVGESASSTADRVTTDAFEGLGSQKLVLKHDGTATNMRIRHLSGSGTVANNVTFTTGPGVDGFIGFYVKTTAQNFTIGINLDGVDGTAATMDMGTNLAVIGDGVWHLYEWDLDDVDTSWQVVTSIGGDGVLQDGQHSIDSIYFFSNQVGAAEQAQPDIFLDFVAKSNSGSIANIPEPSSIGLALVGAIGLVSRRIRRR